MLVGYYMLMGMEFLGFVEGFLREKKIMVRGFVYLELFNERFVIEFLYFDYMRVFGVIFVILSNFFKLFLIKLYIIFFLGGVREVFYRKVSRIN